MSFGGLTAITIDPASIATSRTELALNDGPIRVSDAPDWADAQIQAFAAEMTRGEAPVDFRVPNRQAKIPLAIGTDPASTFSTARDNLTKKVSLLQAEGGWLGRGLNLPINWIPNPSFEYDTVAGTGAGWSTTAFSLNAGASMTVVGTGAQSGSQALKVTTGSGSNAEGVCSACPSITFKSGITYTAAVWLKGNAGGEQVLLRLGNTGDDNVDGPTITLTTSWQRVTLSWTPAADRAGSTHGLVVATKNATAVSFFIDAAMLTEGSATPTYVDGDSARYAWVGTPGNSPSHAKMLYADIVNATLTFPDKYGYLGVEGDVILNLELLPDFYGDEVTLSDHVETTLPHLVFTETSIAGDFPGRLRLVVDEDQAVDQHGLLVGIRSRYYDSASTARLFYEAEALTPLDTAAITGLTGASGSGSNTMRHNNLSTSWLPVMSTNLLAGTYLTHRGSYRVWARVYSTSATEVDARLVWDVGDLVNPEQNSPVVLPSTPSNFYLVDLGEIRLDAVPTGAHRWQGQIQAKGAVGGENLYVDYLLFVPLDEGAVKLTAPTSLVSGISAPSQRDEFNQTAGNLTGKTAAVGGAWAAGAGSSATDFAVDASLHLAKRAAAGDSAWAGRWVLCGAGTPSSVAAQLDFNPEPTAVYTPSGTLRMGLVARYVDANNWLVAIFTWDGTTAKVQVVKDVASSVTTLGAAPALAFKNAWNSLYLFAGADGSWQLSAAPQGAAPGDPLLSGKDAVLAAGGALASGKVGFYDECPIATLGSPERRVDNFLAYAPTLDAAAFASRSVQLGTDGNYRQDATGTAYGPVSRQYGDLLRLPVSGIEGRTVEVLVKLSRGDLNQAPSSGIDDLSARAFYRPSWLFPHG